MYVYVLEIRTGRGKNFSRRQLSSHNDAVDALKAKLALNVEAGQRLLITKQWIAD